jgi:hypothetical protein
MEEEMMKLQSGRQISENLGRRMAHYLILILSLMFGLGSGYSWGEVAIQDISGHLELKENIVYKLTRLKQGETLYVYMKGTSGDLDPLAGLLKPGIDFKTARETYLAEWEKGVAAGRDPLVVIPETLNKFSLIWNDDFGGMYDASFQFKVPANGDYSLLVRSTLARETSGSYRLLIGLDAPEVLKGYAKPTGDAFVFIDRSAAVPGEGVEEGKGTLSRDRYFKFHNLTDMYAGETLYAYVEATSGDLRPVVTLYDFGDKPLGTGNFSGGKANATLEYSFDRPASNCRLKISGQRPDGTITAGDYRILLGIDAPEVLTGKGVGKGRRVLKGPIPVKIGIKMQQITHVEQKAENFGVVATLMMEWQDPALAFNPETVQDRVKIYSGDSYSRAMSGKGTMWPEFTLFNQQGNRWVQNRIVAVFSDGRAIYLERFSTTLQAPDFDFRRFPFDTQQFFIRVDSVCPEWSCVFREMEGYSEVGKQLGEEEWIVTGYDTGIAQAEIAGRPVSRFNFRFEARRHLTYYIFRILLPLLIIIIVSWIIFFLKDYAKRVDAAGANLLLFIAFNFTISSDLPRLGYLTFLDMILISAFVVAAAVLILSVYLKRQVTEGKEAFVQRIDKYVIWSYPLAYFAAVIAVTLLFG